VCLFGAEEQTKGVTMASNDVVILTGIKETLEALKEFDKQAVKKFEKVINDELRHAKKDAQDLIYKAVAQGNDYQTSPLSHWQTERRIGARTEKQSKTRPFPTWDTSEVVAGIVTSKADGKVRGDYTTSAGALINKSAAGRIFELAGRKKGEGKNASGTAFKRILSERYGEASRVVWRIVDRDRPKIQAAIVIALDEAKATLQKDLEKKNSN
jgi:hypothetical protein